MDKKLYRHITDGGAEYLCTEHILNSNEGDVAFAVVRLDGETALLKKFADPKSLEECEKDYEYVKDLLGRLMELVITGQDYEAAEKFVYELKDEGYGIPPQSVVTDESVSLIAAGYEWECPNCTVLNREIEVTANVECPVCHRVYRTDNADHAFGD